MTGPERTCRNANAIVACSVGSSDPTEALQKQRRPADDTTPAGRRESRNPTSYDRPGTDLPKRQRDRSLFRRILRSDGSPHKQTNRPADIHFCRAVSFLVCCLPPLQSPRVVLFPEPAQHPFYLGFGQFLQPTLSGRPSRPPSPPVLVLGSLLPCWLLTAAIPFAALSLSS